MLRRGTVSTLRVLAATAWLALAAEHAGAQDPSLPVESIDVYGSAALDSAAIRAEFEADILRYVVTMDQARSPNANFDEIGTTLFGIREKLRTSLEQRVPLAYFEISVLINSAPPPHINVTIDVVEKADEVRRMPFHAGPTRELADPGGLLAAWNELTGKLFELMRSGRQDLVVTAAECPVLHCVAPFTVPELAPYLERFNAGAREHEEALYTVAAESGLDNQRANALFALAHTDDPERLLSVLGNAIYDPAANVRNNAMRVLLFMARGDPSRDYPLAALLAAWDFPVASDRNKAGYVLVELAKLPRYRDRIRAAAVPVALRQLRLEQPVNHLPAYELLKILSGEDFGERDYAAWERWAATAR